MDNHDLVNRMISLAEQTRTPEFKQRLAEHEARRTDPWRWYCRLCGAKCEHEDRTEMFEVARGHIADGQPCGHGAIKAEDSSGRLLHVWSYAFPYYKPSKKLILIPRDEFEAWWAEKRVEAETW